MMPEFREITILVKYGYEVKTPEHCRDCEEFYTIFETGAVEYSSCCEGTTLDRDIDEEKIHEVIEILQEAIKRIKRYYNLKEG